MDSGSFLLAALCLLLLQDVAIEEVATSTPLPSASRQLGQPAPYAIESKPAGSQEQPEQQQAVRNLVFRLAYNRAEGNRSGSKPEGGPSEPWALVNQNGTLVGSRVNLDLNKLLEALNNNNITTSEVKFNDNGSGGGLLNITISQQPDQHQRTLDESFLEELMIDAKYPTNMNLTSIIRDNHKSTELNRHQSRSKSVVQASLQQQQPNNLHQVRNQALVTPPPIRAAMEVVAENYTVRKIADEANVFALRLLNQLNIEKLGTHNLVQSPFSVYQGLALLLSGAMGDTARELDRVLLGSQSAYENNRLTHDQDRVRLLASFGEVVRQLQLSSSHHFRAPNDTDRIALSGPPYFGGSEEQHLIVANNLLFSPSAFEISNEFKNTLNAHHNNTALTKIEVGSTESTQYVNNWVRRVTSGIIPAIFNRKTTFDEFNVMSLLSTSWLMQLWREPFYKISLSIRTNIRLKGQGKALEHIPTPTRLAADHEPLLEFVDDDKQSHFVEYLKSRPSKSIQHYHAILNGIIVDVVVIPFKDSTQKMITLTPLVVPTANSNAAPDGTTTNSDAPDSSSLSRLISALAQNPAKAMRALWAVVAPDIITKQTYQNIQLAKQMNITVDEKIVQTTITPMVQLSMPMIRVDADSSISAALNHIGIVNAFDRDQANFIGINGHPFNYYKLHLSNVISKTTFNLDARGVNYDRTINSLTPMRIHQQLSKTEQDRDESDAVADEQKKTNININNKDYELEFVDEVKLNKPYIYLIGDFRTKLVIYTGVMRNPQQQTIPR